MKKSTTLRFAVLLGLLSLAAWLPAGTAEATSCGLFEGGACPYEGAIQYCDPSYCECQWAKYYGDGGTSIRLIWRCSPV